MGVFVELLDAVVTKLNETSFGTATVSRKIIPDIEKKDLTPTILVVPGEKESFELDRTHEAVKYTVQVGLHYPSAQGETDYEAGLDMLEDIQDFLADVDNRVLTLTGGSARLVLPFVVDEVADSELARGSGIYFAVSKFTYYYYKDRA